MATDEPHRELQRRLEEVLGAEEAWTLMDQLSTTRHAVEDLRVQVHSRFELFEARMDARLAALEARVLDRMNDQTRTLFRTFLVTNSVMVLAVATLAFGAARLA